MKHEIQHSATIPYSVEKVYDLVNDVEKYPEFLSWCHKAQIHQKDDVSMTASIGIVKGGMQHTLTTKNVLTKDPYKIEMHLISGPFKHLHGVWHFKELTEQRTQIEFCVEFSLASRLLNVVFAPVFTNLTEELTNAFADRAKVCYG